MSEIENASQAEWFARAKFAATAARDRLSAAFPALSLAIKDRLDGVGRGLYLASRA